MLNRKTIRTYIYETSNTFAILNGEREWNSQITKNIQRPSDLYKL